jgi:ATP-dependent exoDNAse (exonuclease V) alpha subunit
MRRQNPADRPREHPGALRSRSDPVRDIQVLCPMNRGGLDARLLNLDLQQALNPPGELRVKRFGSTYGIGDKASKTTTTRQ